MIMKTREGENETSCSSYTPLPFLLVLWGWGQGQCPFCLDLYSLRRYPFTTPITSPHWWWKIRFSIKYNLCWITGVSGSGGKPHTSDKNKQTTVTDSAVVNSPRKSGREKMIPDQYCSPAPFPQRKILSGFPKRSTTWELTINKHQSQNIWQTANERFRTPRVWSSISTRYKL